MLIVIMALFFVGGCSADTARKAGTNVTVGESGAETATTSAGEPQSKGELFGGLTVELTGPKEVASGGELRTTFNVSNETDHSVVDPGCGLGNSQHALIPAETPGEGLWMRTITDCSGPYTYSPGEHESVDGPTFLARTAHGQALKPGPYLAAWSVEGLRLSFAVTVIEQPAQAGAASATSSAGSREPPGQASAQADRPDQLRATLEAESGWAPSDRFAGTILLTRSQDGSISAQVTAEGLQPGQRYGAGVTWDPAFFSSFCVGIADESGRWTCSNAIDTQFVDEGASPKSGDFGDASGRIWAHGRMEPAQPG
jgi:hypothetical protein